MAGLLKLCVVLLALFSVGLTDVIRRKRSHIPGSGGGFPSRNSPGGSFPGGSGGGGFPGGSGGGGFPGKGGGSFPGSGSGGTGGGGSGGSFPGGNTGGRPTGGGSGGNFPGRNTGGGGGGRSSQCQQPNGQFEFREDCSRYVQCDNGKATIMQCPEDLLFNPQTSFCDWPGEVQCASGPPRDRTGSSPLCQASPHFGSPQSFQVQHPQYCNAFYTCSNTHIFAPCMFCPEDMYFDELTSRCADGRDIDMASRCSGRQYIEHRDKTQRQQDGSCWPEGRVPNTSGQPSQNRGGNNPWSGSSGGNQQGSNSNGNRPPSSGSGSPGSGCSCSSCNC